VPLAALLQARPSAPSRRRGGTRTQTPAQRRVLLAYIGLNAALDVVWLLTFGRSHPGLVRERLRPGPGAKEGFLKIFVLYGLPYLGHYVLAALDLGRCHWFRPVPVRLQLAGLIGYFGALGVAMWATAVNPFFSSAVRIQSERGQHVITSGPYRAVRHPGYAAAIPLLISSALALGSWAALPPALVWVATITRRTLLEDRLLREELAGYPSYANRVRYRLLPGVW
jgi:protein-S-isoprenylcysteine O-methyltransferase Ste14